MQVGWKDPLRRRKRPWEDLDGPEVDLITLYRSHILNVSIFSTTESTFAESVGSSCLSAARLSAYLPQSNHDSANYSNNQLENNQAAAAKMANIQFNNYTQLIPCGSSTSSSSTPSSSASTGFSVPRVAWGLPSPLDNDLHFHPVRGSDVVLSADRSAACIHFLDSSRTLVFSDRPLHVGESLYVEVGNLGLPYFGALLFGLTSCDPASLHVGDLPADPEVLLDRKEYWVVHRGFPTPSSGDVLSFTLQASGEVHHGVNGVGRGRLLCVDSSQVLWAFFTLHGAVNRLRIVGKMGVFTAKTCTQRAEVNNVNLCYATRLIKMQNTEYKCKFVTCSSVNISRFLGQGSPCNLFFPRLQECT